MNYGDGSEREPLSKTFTKQSHSRFNLGSFGLGACVGGIVGLALFFGLYFGLPPRSIEVITTSTLSPTTPQPTPTYSAVYDNAAVASDAGPCSKVGVDILKEGGNAVDSAIAAILCVGLHNSHSCGIGGGFFMTLYNATTGEATFINSREVAPAAADKNMFKGNPDLAVLGTLAVAVPGEIAGLWEAHQSHGKLPWSRLFQPSIDMAENGYFVSDAMAKAIQSSAAYIQNRTFNLWPVFENDDGSLKKYGDPIRRPLLAQTLKTIAKEGASAFYNGSLTYDIIKDLNEGFGENRITAEDLWNYRTEVKPAINITLDDLTVFSPGPPASGPVMSLILNILDGYDFSSSALKNKENQVLTMHRIVEAFRFAYAKRSNLGDERNNPNITELVKNMTADWYADDLRLKINDDHTWPVDYYGPDWSVPDDSGTAHLSVLAPNGDAVAITSTINLYFGSKVRGKYTGIIFNNEMDDFSSPNITNAFGVPPSPANFIYPGNRPLSSMTPTVVTETKNGRMRAKMVVGASGGTKITTGTALVTMNSLWFGFNVGESVEMKRIHDQLMPNVTQCEAGLDPEIISGLEAKQHITEIVSSAGSVVQAIVVLPDGKVSAASDSRKGGYPDGF
uniref:glutathione hydrolase 1 proenzyme isoform X1 n=1 Tax=Ciona intestinalis TaxID=7719 RepID=UPI0000522AF8|nr:glutathione hydrolase 1 proenzyme isoform X1 [Ciona intestinalis]|eukprot:XP_018666852.1 glutathione hydrolase 1 proenzyme isoform X1 [Ciona intestinalis]